MEIGGYFGTELCLGAEYHNGIAVNTARNAMELIMALRGYKMIWIPFYSCESMLQPIKKLKLNYRYYHIKADFTPAIGPNEVGVDGIILINYFGLLNAKIAGLCSAYPYAIADNTQAFFQNPLPQIDTVCSCRKFFGVTDGGYLCADLATPPLQQDFSYQRIYPGMRLELVGQAGYPSFRK